MNLDLIIIHCTIMTTMPRIALLQMTSSTRVEENLAFVAAQVHQAALNGIRLLVLPENFAFMGQCARDKFHIAEEAGSGVIQDTISQLAKRHGIWIVAGSIFLKTQSSRVRAASIVFDDFGEPVARYDKIHLFDAKINEQEVHQESLTIEPGHEVVVVDTPVGRLGLSVCYDLRFPELYQQLTIKGVELFSIPSAFTSITGMAHWEVLLRARAIENVCYVLAPNQGGYHENGRHTYGHSMIINPWGTVLGVKKTGLGLLEAELDLEHLRKLRQDFPCVSHHVLFKHSIR